MVIVPVVTALGNIVLSVRHGIGVASYRIVVTTVPLVLAGRCSMPILVRVGTIGWAQPLSIPSRDRNGGAVVRLSSAMWLRNEGGVVADPGLGAQPSLLGLAGPRSFGLSLAAVLWAAWPTN